MKKLLGIFAVSALTILGCTTAFASNSVQGDADTRQCLCFTENS